MVNIKNDLLNITLKFIQAYQNGEEESIVRNCAETIKINYNLLKKENILGDFYQYIKNELQNDNELYIYFLSILYNITLDDKILIEVLIFLNKNEMDLFTKLNIRTQIEACIFTNPSQDSNYQLRRELHKQLVEQFGSLLDLDLPYRPLEFRNENRIVVVTNQLVGDLHAPTYVTKEICYILQKELKMKVLLIVALETTDYEGMDYIWFKPFKASYFPEQTGNFITESHGEKIAGYQIIINGNRLSEVKQLIEGIYDFNPLCVWYMGGLTVFADLLRNYMTELAMPFCSGYAISEAQAMVSYLNTQTQEVVEMEAFLKDNNQEYIHYELHFPLQPSDMKYSKRQYGFSEKDFLITIVGNRLDDEITSVFLSLLRRILDIDRRISIVFIGVFNNYSVILEDDFLKNRCTYLGYQNDLIGILSIMDLFLNPPRKGGATGAIYALYNGTPVITLNNCDVAVCTGPDFICSDEEEILTIILKYMKDINFYQKQSEKARLSQRRYRIDETIKETKRVLEKAKYL